MSLYDLVSHPDDSSSKLLGHHHDRHENPLSKRDSGVAKLQTGGRSALFLNIGLPGLDKPALATPKMHSPRRTSFLPRTLSRTLDSKQRRQPQEVWQPEQHPRATHLPVGKVKQPPCEGGLIIGSKLYPFAASPGYI
tara:strand:+ start:16072 stop:16482 length:411 start_codon:yes stop_codon:yes gene_type:complete